MKNNMAIKYIMLILMVNSCFAYAEDEQKKDVSVEMGTEYKFPCGGMRVVKIGDNYTWYKGQQIVTSYRAKIERSEAKLALEAVAGDGSGKYKCRVIEGAAVKQDRVVEIDVLVPYMNVSIRTDNNDIFEAGTPRVLACIVYGSIPSPNVTWSIGDTTLRPNVYKEVNRGNFTVSSLTFVPSLTDNGKDLMCKATYGLMASTFEDKVTVSVGQRPMCIDNGFKTIGAVEGDTETLVCMVESDPEPEQFIWTFADGRTIYTSSKKVSGHKTRYSSTMIWVPREDDFGPLYCRASNRFGEQKQPCTFSVINGGPPTTPVCEAFWAEQETLKVRCDKNWDGGRPQTIHFEVKGPDGIRKLSRKGHELEVTSLNPGANISAEVYATSSRGRSSSIQLALPPGPHPDDMLPEISEKQVMPQWAVIVIIAAAALVFILLCAWFAACFCPNLLCCTCFNGDSSGNREPNLHFNSRSENLYLQNTVKIKGKSSTHMGLQQPEYPVPEDRGPAQYDPNKALTMEYYCV